MKTPWDDEYAGKGPRRLTLDEQIESFWDKVDVGSWDRCWPWMASRDAEGYGQFQFRPTFQNVRWRPHRFSWATVHGPIPEGFHVCHKCDNPPCCNPEHLFLGDDAANVADKVAKGRQQKGSQHAMAKLKESDVIEIFHLHHGGMRVGPIAARFGVSGSIVSEIIHRKGWMHVELV